jgi:MFS family permease
MASPILSLRLGDTCLGYLLSPYPYPTIINRVSVDASPGFPFAFGIFQEYYTFNSPFAGSPNIAIIGTCALGVMYLSSPLVFGLLAWYPNFRRPCIVIGLVVMCISLGLSSLSQSVAHLIVSQGLVYAIGAALCYSPAITFMDEWFVKRKGLAFGIMWVSLHSLTSVEYCLVCILVDRHSNFRAPADPKTGWDWTGWCSDSLAIAAPLGKIRLSHYASRLVRCSFRSHPSLDHIPQASSSRCASHQPPKIRHRIPS